MNKNYEKLLKCAEYVKEKAGFEPKVGLVLGSGLGEYAENMEIVAEIPYADIEGFPVSTVAGHEGKFLFGYVNQVPTVLMKGRVHFYEGYEMEDVVLPTRIMGLLGVEKLILTNAAGGVNKSYKPGDLMMITDHISSFVKSPLIGPNMEELGPRFPDMSHVYNLELCEKIREAAKTTGVAIKEGIYVQCSGPNYETPAEINMFRALGVDAVGMSTVCEAMTANHMGMKVCGISCITNMAAGILDQPLEHKEVQEVADRVKDTFEKLITEIISTI